MDEQLERAVQEWVAAGVVSRATAEAIRDHEDGRPPGDGERARSGDDGRSLVAEGLAYVGAAFAFGAGAVVLGDVWEDLGPGSRFGLVLAVAVALSLGARALWDHVAGPGHRLATVTAVLAGLAAAAAAGIGLYEWTGAGDGALAAAVGGVALATLVPIHLRRPGWLTTLVLGPAVLAVALGGLDEVLLSLTAPVAGSVLAGLGAAWAAAGWSGLARPRTAFEVTGLLAGGAGLQVLASEPGTAWFGLGLGLVVPLVVVWLGVAEEDTSLTVLGGAGMTIFAPQVVYELFGDAVAGPIALLVTGVVLVLVAVLTLRTRTGGVAP